nr:hypothetical protein CFP56_11776 [Quercus suber]
MDAVISIIRVYLPIPGAEPLLFHGQLQRSSSAPCSLVYSTCWFARENRISDVEASHPIVPNARVVTAYSGEGNTIAGHPGPDTWLRGFLCFKVPLRSCGGRSSESRVHDDQGRDGEYDQHALEAGEEGLVVRDGAREAGVELDDAVHAAPEDEQGGEGQRSQEGVEGDRGAARDGQGVRGERAGVAELAAAAPQAQREVGGQREEAEEREDLPGEAGGQDGVAGREEREVFFRQCGRGQAAADGLQEQREDVAGDELCSGGSVARTLDMMLGWKQGDGGASSR